MKLHLEQEVTAKGKNGVISKKLSGDRFIVLFYDDSASTLHADEIQPKHQIALEV